MTGAQEHGAIQHETVRECDLPTETYDNPQDGEIYSCDGCGRDYLYEDGWFAPLATDGGRVQQDGEVAQSANDTERFADPYEQKLAGETEVVYQCGTAASEHEEIAEMCEHESEKIELDEPAYIDERGNVHLPGRPFECPVCGNPHEFRFNGLVVMFV